MARSPYGDAGAIRAVASRCDHEAGRLDDAARNWESRIGRTRWDCGQASHTRQRIGWEAHNVRSDANELRRLAGELRRHADQVADATRARDHAERSARQWIAARRNDPRFAGMLPAQPAAGSTDWIRTRDWIRRRFGGI